jgi:hypothetical protein
VTSDNAAILSAINAANGKVVYFPAGTYKLTSILIVPNEATLAGSLNVGPTNNTAWLEGRVDYGSNCNFTDLKIGPAVAGRTSTHPVDGSNGTTFTRVHFRGGGGNEQIDYSTLTIGDHSDVSNLTFTDCEVERSLGTFNAISIYAQSNIVDGVTFTNCHFGVSNGIATGSRRMMIEAWTSPGVSNQWRNLTFIGNTFEPSYWTQLDLASYGPGSSQGASGRGTNVLVQNNIFKGGGYNQGGGDNLFGYAICSESALNTIITGNTFYRSYYLAIHSINYGWPADNNMQITNNTFNNDISYINTDVHATGGIITLENSGAVVTGNTLRSSALLGTWRKFIELTAGDNYGGVLGGSNHTVTGNTIYHNSSQTHPLIKQNYNPTNNTITPNTELHI